MRCCFDSGAHAYAAHVLDQLATRGSAAFVPILWRYEVSAVLARTQIKAMFPAEKAAEFLRSLAALDIRVDDDSADRVLTDVRRLAVQYRLTSYDAAYLEVAQRRNLSLATLDDELRAAAAAAGVSVL